MRTSSGRSSMQWAATMLKPSPGRSSTTTSREKLRGEDFCDLAINIHVIRPYQARYIHHAIGGVVNCLAVDQVASEIWSEFSQCFPLEL